MLAYKPEDVEETKENNEELIRAYQNRNLRMTTALLLAYEQAYRNSFNYNKLTPDQMSRKPKDNSCIAFAAVTVKEIIKLGLQPCNCLEQAATTLQILLLLCEQKEVLDRSELAGLLGVVTECLTGTMPNDEELMKVFEVLSLCAIVKIVDRVPFTKGKDPLLDIVINDKSFLTKICVMRKFKPYMRVYVDMLIAKIGQYPSYHKPLVNELKDKVSVEASVVDGGREAGEDTEGEVRAAGQVVEEDAGRVGGVRNVQKGEGTGRHRHRPAEHAAAPVCHQKSL